MVSPYDWNEAVQHRSEYVEQRLRDGSPVVGLRYHGGILLLSLRRSQQKIFEIYDRIMMSAIGNQADIEAIRIASLDFAHQEGFARSPDDVTVNRLVGFAISPALKKAYGDTWSSPLVFRGVFAELGASPEKDRFATLNFDGEFSFHNRFAVSGGTRVAEDAMQERLLPVDTDLTLENALAVAVETWAIGHQLAQPSRTGGEEDEPGTEAPVHQHLRQMLERMTIEAAVMEHDSPLESRFRLLEASNWTPVLESLVSSS